tara:strand:- start:1025 stop:1612 length:588 start_codon:yes stop_codon:yes gene_type:complete
MLQTTQLIGFGGGVSGGLSALTSITAAMWDGDTSKWTLSGDDALKTESSTPNFSNIRIKHATAPVLDGDFVWQYTQTGAGGGATDSSYGFYDISEDSTWASQSYKQNMNSMTSSYYIDMDGTQTFGTRQAASSLASSISFSTGDTFKWERVGTSLKWYINDTEKEEWTSVSASLRFGASGFTPDAASISDIQFQN